ncbi:MAG: RecQ family ATP-dependent DNA helicase [Bacteroidales bacterium]|nr:RecQ family ATP-dependent DNA helicase [Bacteroidales bacterium]
MAKINDYFDRIRNGFFTSDVLSGIVFIDTEVGVKDKKIHDYGAYKEPNNSFHSSSKKDFELFISKTEYLCGHNIIHHDLKYLSDINSIGKKKVIDTLYLSPLLFPRRPYHKLLKDDKIQSDELNNPLNDCLKARDLFYDEVNAYNELPESLKQIFAALLCNIQEFKGFFQNLGFIPVTDDVSELIKKEFMGEICSNSPIEMLVNDRPVELAYSLALIATDDFVSVTPPWLLKNYPYITNVINLLCNKPCHDTNCIYCRNKLDIHRGLNEVFGYSEFRTFDGEPMQEMAVQAAIDGESLLTIFPTGGGKSLTFQLPAIITGRAVHGLTVVISPLQSLMKDQVDNLAENGLTEAVTINGLLDPISRADAFERVANGSASLLYIAPEMLRSKTIENLLVSRTVVRFVIDEAHCFSSWGHDFRVDYLYIGDFIKKLQKAKGTYETIPVSCFTATAKQKVITDICDYFKKKLNLDLKIFASSSTRKNLHYSVIHADTEEAKYNILRDLLIMDQCPTIIYVSRTQKTIDLAQKLSKDGISALPFNGKMESSEKIANQNDFISNRVRAMVATSAFGMGVDKKDVGMVIHYDISDSLENYVQEAGRAGRDPKTDAKCYVLYSDHDLDKHFILLNQTKISISEIQQVWKAIKDFTKLRKRVNCSALEIARQAGWNENVADVETRVRTAVAALEEAGYVSRGNNVPHVFATGIMVKNMDEARARIEKSRFFNNDNEKQNAIRIIKSLISQKHICESTNDDAESRVDYLADMLGLTKGDVISSVNMMRQDGILADSRDMTVYLENSENKSQQIFERFAKLERFLITTLADNEDALSYKELNESAIANGVDSNIKNIKTLLYYLQIKSLIKKKEKPYNEVVSAMLCQELEPTLQKHDKRVDICRFIIKYLYYNASTFVQFSVTALLKEYVKKQNYLLVEIQVFTIEDIEDALLYLSKIGALKLEGGFLVLYNAMEINRLTDMKYRYKVEDYRMLDEFYKQKIRQIHIVGEFANLMVRDYDAALQYVNDYFQLDFKKFIDKYFKGERQAQIEKNIRPEQYNKLFGEMSEKQKAIINDKQSKYIVVAAGPGSGKTRVLVHKLASLLLLEDVKHEQLLMLTFSRAAATEFKQRLISLIGNAAHYVEIKTFHAFSFDILGKTGNLEDADNIVAKAAQMIENGEAEQGRINRAVLVIDEAQDMDENEYALVRALIKNNEEMRVVAVGDDDQNIYEFRGSNSRYMQSLITDFHAVKYEMTENYRSVQPIVSFSNDFIKRVSNRIKVSPCVSVRNDLGAIKIIRHKSENLEIPLVNDLIETYNNEKTCVLTNTNYEASQVVGLLKRKGIKAKLIQSVDGFRFGDLAEIRYFQKLIDNGLQTPIISQERWNEAKNKTLTNYQSSSCVDYIKEFFSVFEQTNHVKYRSDLADFIFESNLEDFCGTDTQTIFVSTIHKAKGREFDTVYMLLDDEKAETDEKIRKLYVGITRAKHNLFVHCNTNIFDNIRNRNVLIKQDSELYQSPDEISLHLGHRDVFLDYFKGKKTTILKMRNGMPLFLNNGYLCSDTGVRLIAFSAKFKTELLSWEEMGYKIKSASINYILAWKGKEDKEETAIILPCLTLKKY